MINIAKIILIRKVKHLYTTYYRERTVFCNNSVCICYETDKINV